MSDVETSLLLLLKKLRVIPEVTSLVTNLRLRGQLDWAWLKRMTLKLYFGVKKWRNRKLIFGTFIYALWSYQNRNHPVGHIDTLTKSCDVRIFCVFAVKSVNCVLLSMC